MNQSAKIINNLDYRPRPISTYLGEYELLPSDPKKRFNTIKYKKVLTKEREWRILKVGNRKDDKPMPNKKKQQYKFDNTVVTVLALLAIPGLVFLLGATTRAYILAPCMVVLLLAFSLRDDK